MLERIWRKGNLCALLVRKQLSAVTMGNNTEVPQKLKNITTICPLLFDMYPKDRKTESSCDICTSNFTVVSLM